MSCSALLKTHNIKMSIILPFFVGIAIIFIFIFIIQGFETNCPIFIKEIDIMALIQCNECGHDVSTLADHCIQCGYPIVRFDRTLEEFRRQRLHSLSSEHAGASIEGAKVIAHLVPRDSLMVEKTYGIVGISAYISRSLHLLFGGTVEPQFNYNGIILQQLSYDTHKLLSSLEIHRNGVVEAIDSLFFGVDKNVGYFLIDLFMDRIVAAVNEVLQIYKLVGVKPPFALMVSLTGIKDHTVSSKTVHYPGKRAPQNAALLQKIEFDSTNPIERTDLRQFFEQLWNTFGYMRVRNMGKQAGVSNYSKA